MKTLAVLTLVLLTLALTVSPALAAGTVVDKPDLPSGYEKWPQQYGESCVVNSHTLNISISARITAKNRIEAVMLFKVNAGTVIAVYRAGSTKKDSPEVARDYVFELGTGKWLMFNAPDPFPNENLEKNFGITELDLLTQCMPMAVKLEEFGKRLEQLAEDWHQDN